MHPTSIRLEKAVLDELDAEAEERGVTRTRLLQQIIKNRNDDSAIRSDYDRLQSKFQELRDDYDDLEAEYEKLEARRNEALAEQQRASERAVKFRDERNRLSSRVDELETERDRLQRQLAAANARQDDLGELVEYVEGEKSLRERREERESAPVWRRAWWWIAGVPEADA